MSKWRILLVCLLSCVVVLGCGGPKAPSQPVLDEAAVVETPTTIEVEEVVEPPVVDVITTDIPETPVEPVVTVEADVPGEQPVQGGVPKAVVDEPVYNYGTRTDDESVTHHFVLRNEGTGILKIENVRASCGCTTTDLPTDTLAPGEEVKIGAVTNLRGRQGKQVKTVTVFTNDPENQTIQLRLEGDVQASIMIEPTAVNFGRIDDNEPREAKVVVKSTKDDLTFAINSAELSDMDFVEHEITEVEEGRTFEIVIRTTGEVPVGNHNSRMIIRTDARERAVLWLPISMQVVGALQIMPPVINIRYSEEPGELEQQQLRITPGRVAEFEILDVVAPLDGIEPTLMATGDNAYTLRLANMPRNDDLEGKSIILRTNIPGHEEIEIPFNIYKPRRPTQQLPNIAPALRERMQRPPAGVDDVADAPATQLNVEK